MEEEKKRLEKVGIFFEGVYFDLGRGRYIELSGVSISVDNGELLRWLCEADENWERLVNALSLERILADEGIQVSDIVDVEEVKCTRRGFYVRLSVSAFIDELPEKIGCGDIDVQEMERTLEDILREEANKILKALEQEHQSLLHQNKI